MAQANTLDFLIAAHVTGQEQMSKLINDVGALQKEMDRLRETTKRLEAAMGGTESVVRKNGKALDDQSKALRNHRQGVQQLGMQFNDFATSVSTGASPIQALSQQLGQLGYAMSMMKGRAASIGAFIAGPWGAMILLGISVVTALWDAFSSGDEASKKFQDATKQAEDALFDYKVTIANTREELIALYETQLAGKEMEWRKAATDVGRYGGAVQRAGQLIDDSFSGKRLPDWLTIGAAVDKAMNQGKLDQARADERAFYADMIRAQTALDRLKKGFAKEDERAANKRKPKAKEDSDLEKLRKAQQGIIDQFEAGKLAPAEFEKQLKAVTDGYKDAKQPAEDYIKEWERQDQVAKTFRDTIASLGKKELPAWEQSIVDLSAKYKELSVTTRMTAEDTAAFGQAVTNQLLGPVDDQIKKYDDLIAKAYGIEDSFDATRASLIATAQAQGVGLAELIAKLAILDQRQKDLKIVERNAEIKKSYESIGNAVSDSFKAMLTAGMSWKDGMKSIIGSVIDELWRLYVVKQIVGFVTKAIGGVTGSTGLVSSDPLAQAFDSAFPPKAAGGYVGANRPYMVGERGPELFVPGGSGTIIPNKNIGGAGGGQGMVINVDARGSNDPAAVRAQVQQGILEAAPAIIAAAQSRTVQGLRRPRLGGAMQ